MKKILDQKQIHPNHRKHAKKKFDIQTSFAKNTLLPLFKRNPDEIKNNFLQSDHIAKKNNLQSILNHENQIDTDLAQEMQNLKIDPNFDLKNFLESFPEPKFKILDEEKDRKHSDNQIQIEN